MSNSNKVLNLDDMLGQKGIKVSWKSNEYPLKLTTDLTPEEYMEVMSLGEKFVGYKNITISADLPNEIIKSVARMIEILAPELSALNLPFSGQMLVLEFWKNQQADPAKKKQAKAI